MKNQSVPAGATLDWPLMQNNITREDLDAAIAYLRQEDPILTQSSNVRSFDVGGPIDPSSWPDRDSVGPSVFFAVGVG